MFIPNTGMAFLSFVYPKTNAIICLQGWPVNKPDVIVSTPAAFLNNIDPNRHRRMDFIRGVKYVVSFSSTLVQLTFHLRCKLSGSLMLIDQFVWQVFDEADMLLCGSFQNQVIRLINMLRFDEKSLFRNKSYNLKQPVELSPDTAVAFDEEGDECENSNITLEDDNDEEEEDEDSMPDNTLETEEGNDVGWVKRRDWRRVRREYERSKQYIFVAATLPTNGKKTAGAVLKKMFPDAKCVSGNYLHYHNPRYLFSPLGK